MQANSFDKPSTDLKALKTAIDSSGIQWSGRLLMLMLNFIPLALAVTIAVFLLAPYANPAARIGISLLFFYLAPPLFARAILASATITPGHITVGSRPFFSWWMLFQLQVIFCRFAAFEEALRLVPGLYSLWLRLWGSRIGRLTYWSPGVLITDRSFLFIGNDVVFGAGVRLNPHVLARDKGSKVELLLAPVTIGNRAIVGGYSLLTAGTEISPNETTRAFLISPPFSVWRDGKRVRSDDSPDIE